jgi:hypothetical protein
LFVGTVLLLGVSLLIAHLRECEHQNAEFEPQVWKEHLDLRDSVLTEQADRLYSSRKLLGKSRDDMREWLGSPSYWVGPNEAVYRLGPMGFGGVDWEWLSVEFAPDGCVSGLKRWSD